MNFEKKNIILCIHINTLRLRQMDAISQTTFSNAFSWIPIKISLKLVSKGPINNIPAMVQIMAWVNDESATAQMKT